MNEARYGGLIDKYWILDYIIIPIVFIVLVVGIIYIIGLSLKCPYTEDVSSCFPYNLPNWIKLSIPLIIIIVLGILIFLVLKFKEKGEGK